jgi:seryl-tRNA synthetase
LFENGVKFVEPADLSGSLRGRQNLHNHLDMMVRSAEKTNTLVTTADGLNRKIEALMPSFEKAKKRGVEIKVAAPITPENVKLARQLSKVAEVRDTTDKKLNGRFAIIDNGQLMFMLTDDKNVHPNYDVGVWLSTDYFSKVMNQMFDLAWTDFVPLSKVKVK